MTDINQYNTFHTPTWCPGCGDFGIWAAIKNSLGQQNLETGEVVFVYGIGCNSNMFNTLKLQEMESLHGRPIPLAEGIKTANHKVKVVVVAGDGDTFGEGTNHFVHAARRNTNITVLVHDNQIYGLTAGQTSPTTKVGIVTKSSPHGNIEYPSNPIALALSAGATFAARGFAGDIPDLSEIITAAMNHKGFAFVDILQPCVTFNHLNTYPWYRERIYKLDKTKDKRDDLFLAFNKAFEGFFKDEKIPIGIFYEVNRPSFEDLSLKNKDALLRDLEINNLDISDVLNSFR